MVSTGYMVCDLGFACYTRLMPTTLKRTNITHTPRVERLLNVAAKQWPDEPPREQIIRLMEEGAEKVEEDDAQWRANVEAFLDRQRRYFDGIDSAKFKELSLAEWPE